MEYFDLYNENRQKVNKTILRGQECPDGLCRMVVHLCIFNKKGEMLIQQRHHSKQNWPEYWDLTLGGCVKKGETSKQAIQRELFEELGVKHDFSNERAYITINFDNGFDDYYFIEKNINIKDINFIDNEVQAVKWASKADILQLIETKKFINYYPSLISAIFEMREKRGSHKP